MFTFTSIFPKIKSILILSFTLTSLTMSAETETRKDSLCVDAKEDTISPKDNILKKVIRYFESSNKEVLTNRPRFSFIGGPHYSSDTKFGIGLLAAGRYSTCPEDTTLEPSNVTLFADVTTGKYIKVGIEGLHQYKRNNRRIDYEFSFDSYGTYYWGIGVARGMMEQNKTKYQLFRFQLSADYLWKVWKDLYVGPLMKLGYTSAKHIQNRSRWFGQPLKVYVAEIGGKIQFDNRDNYTYPTKGWIGDLAVSYNQGLTRRFDKQYATISLNLCNYTRVWKSGVVASRLHGIITMGATPWCNMPTLGCAGTMRGYYEGQYRDKQEVDLTLELRQHLMGRSGIVVFGGVGAIFHSINRLEDKQVLPSYGIGYRWEFKKNTNVRIDLGFGKKCWGIDFSIGEAF